MSENLAAKIWLLLFSFPFVHAVDFVLFTEPKSGTHLLLPILTELTGKHYYWAKEYKPPLDEPRSGDWALSTNPAYFFFSPDNNPWTKETMDRVWALNQRQGTFLHLHAPYTTVMEQYLRERNCINFFIKRDPRDLLISLLNHYKYIHFNDKAIELLQSDDERLLAMIRMRLRWQTQRYMGWLTSPLCCVLDFGKLMGSHGGVESDREALRELRKVVQALDLPYSDILLKKLYKRHFGKGWSFFRGKVGAWKDYFKEVHKIATKEEIGDLLIELGYESDYNW